MRKREKGIGKREEGVRSRKWGIGKREKGVGRDEKGRGKRLWGARADVCALSFGCSLCADKHYLHALLPISYSLFSTIYSPLPQNIRNRR
jgi:hypothetical protein